MVFYRNFLVLVMLFPFVPGAPVGAQAAGELIINPYPLKKQETAPSAEIGPAATGKPSAAVAGPEDKAEGDAMVASVESVYSETGPRSAPDENIFWSGEDLQKEWNVRQGSNLRRVLEDWSEEAGVRLVWHTKHRFLALESFGVRATYEDAVRRLLDQYPSERLRPYGSLHIDPRDGHRILVIESE